MRKILFTATMLSLLGGAAFAGMPQGWIAAGDANLAVTSAGSNAGVASTQGTGSQAFVGGNGAVLVGTVSGNYTDVQTGSQAKAGPGGSQTDTYAQQVNIGGTVSGGLGSSGQGSRGSYGHTGSGAVGSTGGGQTSQASGTSTAGASNANLGGFLTVQQFGGSSGQHRPGKY